MVRTTTADYCTKSSETPVAALIAYDISADSKRASPRGQQLPPATTSAAAFVQLLLASPLGDAATLKAAAQRLLPADCCLECQFDWSPYARR